MLVWDRLGMAEPRNQQNVFHGVSKGWGICAWLRVTAGETWMLHPGSRNPNCCPEGLRAGVEGVLQRGLEDSEVKPTRGRAAMRPWEGKGIPGKPGMPDSQVSTERTVPAAKYLLHLKARSGWQSCHSAKQHPATWWVHGQLRQGVFSQGCVPARSIPLL